MFENKNILITGGTGLIGRKLIKILKEKGAKIFIASLDDPKDLNEGNLEFIKTDLRYLDNCIKCTKNMDIVFHLAGIKGSPKMCEEKPASFLTPTVTFSFNMLEASRLNKVKEYLFTSSVGVYSPAEKFFEEKVWETFPSKNDWFAGWAKRLCELQVEAYSKQYNWKTIYIVRPANVYGPYDNFDNESAMVIPSMIKKFLNNKEKEITFWGDGSPIRDFIFSEDVARGMISVMENKFNKPINLGSGIGYSIKDLASTIKKILKSDINIKWDTSKPNGDKKRLMDISNYKKINFELKYSLEDGIKETIEWYNLNLKNTSNWRYNSFTEFEK
jgi:GDP-L-fucose synthase